MAAAKCSISTLEPEHHRLTPVGGPWAAKGEPNAQVEDQGGRQERFKITGTGKVLFAQSGKRHGMIKRTTKQIREHRGTKVLFKTDGDRIKKYWLPNS